MTPTSTIRGDEVERINRPAAAWWNRTWPMRPLHVINGLRLGFIARRPGADARWR